MASASTFLRWLASGWRLQLVLFVLVCLGIEKLAARRLIVEGIEKPGSKGRFDPTTEFRVACLKGGEINDDGLRDRDIYRPMPPGGVRIMCIGDSVTFGSGNRYWDTYPRQLEPMLAGSPPHQKRIQVINSGQLGFGFLQSARLFFDLAERYQPQVVVALVGFNEPYNDVKGELVVPTQNLWRRRSFSDHARVVLHKTATYRYLKARLRPPLSVEEQRSYQPQPYAELSIKNIRHFASFLRQHNVPFVLAIEALRSYDYMLAMEKRTGMIVSPGHSAAEYTPLRDGLKKLGAEMRFPVIDFGDEFARLQNPEDRIFQTDDVVHLTWLGNRIVAENLARTLRTLPVVQAASDL